MRWLERRGQAFYAVMDVPRPLRAAIGKKRMVRSLGTRDQHVAIARRHAALAEFQRAFTAARSRSTADPLVTAAMDWRGELARVDRHARHAPDADPYDDDPGAGYDDRPDVARSVLHDEAERIGAEHGQKVGGAFLRMALGKETPLTHYVPSWVAEGGSKGPLRERTKRQYTSDLKGLEAWLNTAGLPTTIEAMTRRTAGRYITEGLAAAGIDPKTGNRKISAASSYWRWLVKRGHVESNPWQGQSFPKASGRSQRKPKRPFTDAEAATLLNGPADLELSDAMRIAALSGMRIEELYLLTIADCADGWFNVRDAKTRAGVRRVPIHSGLTGIVTRRSKGKSASAFLFPEAGPRRPGRERSMPASKRFGGYRRRLGVDEHLPGRRQSCIDFHSWRRWFVTKARNAGFDRAIVAAVVGHEAGNLTDDVYSGGPTEELRRACVEAVKLPVAAPSVKAA